MLPAAPTETTFRTRGFRFGAPPDEAVSTAIDDAVLQLIRSKAALGWEPAEAFDAASLWAADKVKRTTKEGGFMTPHIDWEIQLVRLTFRRRTTGS